MKKKDLVLSDQAAEDLSEIWLFIATDHPDAADRFIDFLLEKCLLLCTEPNMGRRRDEILPGIRSFSVRKYIIYYRIQERAIEIIRILSGYRDVDALF